MLFGLHWHIYPIIARPFASRYSSAHHFFLFFVARWKMVTASLVCFVFRVLTKNGRQMILWRTMYVLRYDLQGSMNRK
jgi:hypothetical protein